jgi:hypothetical protein
LINVHTVAEFFLEAVDYEIIGLYHGSYSKIKIG